VGGAPVRGCPAFPGFLIISIGRALPHSRSWPIGPGEWAVRCALLRPYRSGVGLSLLGCGYASVGYSVQPVRSKARAGIGSNVSGL
jgi:hypothetical protein